MYEAKILADSINVNGDRLISFEITFPRIVLAEFNTHRVLSRNSASSRAIPIGKMLRRVQEDPFIPIWWGKNQKGMAAVEELAGEDKQEAMHRWLAARDQAISAVRHLQEVDVHKQIANRLLEPWLWHTVICSSTEYDNFFGLRRHKDAQPEIKRIADMMFEERRKSEPVFLKEGEWHLPLMPDIEELQLRLTEAQRAMVSCARCARVSYLTHDGKRDVQEDLNMAERLLASNHLSPFEHAAYATTRTDLDLGNFKGFRQYRKRIPNEAVFRA